MARRQPQSRKRRAARLARRSDLSKHRATAREAVGDLLAQVPAQLPDLPDDIGDEIEDAALVAAWGRGAVPRTATADAKSKTCPSSRTNAPHSTAMRDRPRRARSGVARHSRGRECPQGCAGLRASSPPRSPEGAIDRRGTHHRRLCPSSPPRPQSRTDGARGTRRDCCSRKRPRRRRRRPRWGCELAPQGRRRGSRGCRIRGAP